MRSHGTTAEQTGAPGDGAGRTFAVAGYDGAARQPPPTSPALPRSSLRWPRPKPRVLLGIEVLGCWCGGLIRLSRRVRPAQPSWPPWPVRTVRPIEWPR